MFPMRIGTKSVGVMDVRSYDFDKNEFNGDDNKKYILSDIEYFIIPKDEMVKILGLEKSEAKDEVIKEIKNSVK